MILLAIRATAVHLLIKMTPHIKMEQKELIKTNTTELQILKTSPQKTGGTI